MGNLKTIRNHKEGSSPEQILDMARHEKKFKKILIIGENEKEETIILGCSKGSDPQYLAFAICEMQSWFTAQTHWTNDED